MCSRAQVPVRGKGLLLGISSNSRAFWILLEYLERLRNITRNMQFHHQFFFYDGASQTR